ncbi:sigma-54-dependent transcriptional regulator [Photobacterium sanguinicancri]|uniref:sigma-54-dependent transcriptional regulator n=1 Tax=Photobacterium sanguinicancri TaxID=875932 RepID=UPI003D0E0C62
MGSALFMSSDPGALVVFGGGKAEWLSTLEQAGWMCHRCYDLRAAEGLLIDVGPCIGVIDLSQDDFSLQGIAALVNRNKQVRWLALVRDDQLKSDAICQFIVNFCIDYFTAPLPISQLQKTIGHQIGMLQLERKIWPQLGQFGHLGLQGDSDSMKKLRHQVRRVAATDVPVFIQGEVGTGKELAAQAIFQASKRARAGFIRIACQQLTSSWLLQQETDSDETRCILTAAKDGVLYLDEIADLSDARQRELLQYIEDGEFTTQCGRLVGGDIRLILATRHEPEELLTEGKLRKDLYYRLNVLNLAVPALRERQQDIVDLANFFLLKFARQYNSVARQFSEEAIRMLQTYLWPGNVRELLTQVKRAVLLAEQPTLEADQLDIPRLVDDKQSLKKIREESERSALLAVLENNKGQISAAARELGVSRATMYRLLNKHDLITSPKNFRQSTA